MKLRGCICTQAEESFIKRSNFMKLEYKPEPNNVTTVAKLSGNEINVISSYTLHIVINKLGYYIPIHVVSDGLIPDDLLLGINFMRQVDITIKAGDIKITRAMPDNSDSDDTSSDEADIFLMMISTMPIAEDAQIYAQCGTDSILGMVDTGSRPTLMRETIFRKLSHKPTLQV